MKSGYPFEIVAHRGVSTDAPENSIAAFERAIELGADSIALDVRLTADQVPVIFHYYYLDNATSATGAIFNYSLDQLRRVKVLCKNNPGAPESRISTLSEVLDAIGGRIGIEIEIKGPELESPHVIAVELEKHKDLWKDIEITSYYPAVLLTIQQLCPGLSIDLLYRLSSSWMKLDIVQYEAIHLSLLARAKGVHLHPSQLNQSIVDEALKRGIEVHAWDVNDELSLKTVSDLHIPRLSTDNLTQALAFRASLGQAQ